MELRTISIVSTVFNHAVKALLETVVLHGGNVTDWAIVDLEASRLVLVIDAPTLDWCLVTRYLTVKIPDGGQIKVTHTCSLTIPQLPE